MNNVVVSGNIGKEPDIKESNDKKIARFSLAVKRRFSKDETDWITCFAFDKTAEYIEKYLHKGSKIIVCGEIRTGSYTNKEGNKVYTTEVLVNNVESIGGKNTEEEPKQKEAPKKKEEPEDKDFMNVEDDIDGDLPFN